MGKVKDKVGRTFWDTENSKQEELSGTEGVHI